MCVPKNLQNIVVRNARKSSQVSQLALTPPSSAPPTGMTSNAIRGIRRKKSSLSEVKIAVLGAPGVGKSGEYDQ